MLQLTCSNHYTIICIFHHNNWAYHLIKIRTVCIFEIHILCFELLAFFDLIVFSVGKVCFVSKYTKEIAEIAEIARLLKTKLDLIHYYSGFRVVEAILLDTTVQRHLAKLVGHWCILGDWRTSTKGFTWRLERGTSWCHLSTHRNRRASRFLKIYRQSKAKYFL